MLSPLVTISNAFFSSQIVHAVTNVICTITQIFIQVITSPLSLFESWPSSSAISFSAVSLKNQTLNGIFEYINQNIMTYPGLIEFSLRNFKDLTDANKKNAKNKEIATLFERMELNIEKVKDWIRDQTEPEQEAIKKILEKIEIGPLEKLKKKLDIQDLLTCLRNLKNQLKDRDLSKVSKTLETLQSKIQEQKVQLNENPQLQEIQALFTNLVLKTTELKAPLEIYANHQKDYSDFNQLMSDCSKKVRELVQTHFLGNNDELKNLPPIGLENEEWQVCFLNVIRQLLMIPPLFNDILMNLPDAEFTCTKNYSYLLRLAQLRKDSKPLRGGKFIRNEINLQTGCQEDATEALNHFLNKINPIKFKDPNERYSPNNAISSPILPFFWTKTSRTIEIKNDTQTSSALNDQIECTKLQPDYDLVWSLKLRLPDSKSTSFKDLVEQWSTSSSDTLGTQEAQVEPRRFMQEQTQLTSLPKFLFITLDRFRYDLNSTNPKKILTAVQFDNLSFSMPSDYVKTKETGDYAITCFIVHAGTTADKGHYLIYRKINDQWYSCNDETVTPVDSDVAEEALKVSYIIYAERVGKKPQFLSIDEQKPLYNTARRSSSND